MEITFQIYVVVERISYLAFRIQGEVCLNSARDVQHAQELHCFQWMHSKHILQVFSREATKHQ